MHWLLKCHSGVPVHETIGCIEPQASFEQTSLIVMHQKVCCPLQSVNSLACLCNSPSTFKLQPLMHNPSCTLCFSVTSLAHTQLGQTQSVRSRFLVDYASVGLA